MEADNASISEEMMITSSFRIKEEDRWTSPRLSAIGVEIMGITAMSAAQRCQKTGKEEKSNFVEKREEETLLMAFHAKDDPELDVWYVDTGCSNHMSAI
ncbi:unnamed protein product [Camellia sinensis]